MADKLVRKLTNKTTGAPIVGATVVARPVTASGAEGDISMPETPANSGIYATSSQINHSTYKILVGGVDSMDEVTVEPGRAKVRSGSSSFMYPLLDKLVDVKLIVSALLTDSSPSATAAEFRSAILAATASDAVHRPLILDQEVTLGTSVDVSQDLHLDLNGHTLNLSANITSSTSRITVVGGKINVGTGCKIQGTTTCFVNCEFIGTGAGTFPQVDPSMTFVGCSGLTQLPGAENDVGTIASVAGGQQGFGTASSLRLTTKGARSGSGRLTALQNWIDQTLSDSIRMGIISWLWSAKAVLDEWVNIPPEKRAFLAAAPSYAVGGQASNATFLASLNTPSVVKKYGIKCGIAITGNVDGASPNLKGCFAVVGTPTQQDYTSVTVNDSDLKVSESNLLQFDGSGKDGTYIGYIRCRSFNPSTGVLTDLPNGGEITSVTIFQSLSSNTIRFNDIPPVGNCIYDFEITLPGAGADLFSY